MYLEHLVKQTNFMLLSKWRLKTSVKYDTSVIHFK